jgi:hypothetical protein
MFERVLHMKTFYTLDWNKPAPGPLTFYIVNINTFTHERELQLKSCCQSDISNIGICRPGAGKQPGSVFGNTVIIPCQKREFREDEHDPV